MPTKNKAFLDHSKFEICGDNNLADMLDGACDFIDSMRADDPHWLSFVGKPGTGKTMLAREILSFANEYHKYWQNDAMRGVTQSREIYFKTFGQITQCIFDQQSYQFDYLGEAWLLIIDDFGAGYDKSGYVTSKLLELLNKRLGMWTVITSNQTLEQISQQVDDRIASRLIRDKNIVINCDAIDYAMRKI